MYPIPPNETLVETKTCHHCSALFPITDKDLEFYEKVSPVFPLLSSWAIAKDPGNSGDSSLLDSSLRSEWQMKIEWNKVRYIIPTPTLCPDCRQQRRLSFRNERKLYKRKCDATNKDIISIYSPDKPFKVYHQDYWWSDKWDPMEYWRDFDFGRGFFEQFGEMMREVPHLSILWLNNENSDYGNGIFALKDSYLCFNCDYLEDSYYCTNSIHCKSCIDCLGCQNSELLYWWIHCVDSYGCIFSANLENCKNCISCSDCKNCEFCIGSNNQVNKKFVIYNIQCSEAEYKEEVQKLKVETYITADIVKNMSNKNCENVVWSYIHNSKNAFLCFEWRNLENVKYWWYLYDVKNSYDYDVFGDNSELINDCIAVWPNCYGINYWCCVWWGSQYCNYCFLCFASTHLFWCIGLRNKQYCILNKQYTKDEYEALIPRIIEHMMKSPLTPLTKGGSDEGAGGFEWGEFFPSSLSPFGYNETVAMEYYPLDRPHPQPFSTRGEGSLLFSFPSPYNGEGSGVRFNWSDYEAPFPRVEKIIPADKLPDDISKIPDDILNWAIECEVTKKPFRIIKQELDFYRKHHLPIPRRHPDQRHLDRMALRNPRKLFERKCDKCGVEMVTTYSPERKETVYCESCYNAEVIG